MKKTLPAVFAILFLTLEFAVAAPTTSHRAEKAVKGWLIRTKARPLGVPLGRMIMRVDSFTDGKGEVIYYIVYLQPSGFVIVSADDLIVPIIGFASAGHYDPSLDNPLGALVTQDLNARTVVAREAGKRGRLREHKSFSDNRNKWSFLESTGEQTGDSGEMQALVISDVRVAPLVESRWDQTTVCSNNCYNIYTPDNYPCGCVATAMAQLMRYYQHPVGTYSWTDMVLIPDCSTTLIQRQAIGTICHDAGVAVNMNYGPDGSSADTLGSANAFVNTFNYSNAVKGYNSGNNIGSGLNGMLNPNLDANYPCLLGITGPPGGHAIVCDGYGYNSSTLYHHLNMGWSGTSDAWYDLPDIDNTIAGDFDSVYKCVYNVYTAGSGEIISGRVTDDNDSPISGATVTATRTGGGTYIATTNSKGIYALAKIPSGSTYTITVSKTGYSFASRIIRTEASTDYSNTSGNVWGADFEGSAPKYSGGTGTPEDPYRIATPEDLNDIDNHQEDRNKHFILINDINLAQYTGAQFNIIGTYDEPFTGVFDGNDHKIYNFTWSSDSIGDIGLFGRVGGGEIKNLGMESVSVHAVSGYYVGGLVGLNGGTITNSYSTGNIDGSGCVGGLVGSNGGTISSCHSTGSVSGDEAVGSLVGNSFLGEITSCYSTGSVSGNCYVGGLVGYNYCTITNSYSTGNVDGNDCVGGLVGINWEGTITNCYSTGSVTEVYNVGGLVGYKYGSAVVMASFWDTQTSDCNTSADGEGKTTAEMKTKSTFTDADWDFVNIWDICEGINYPRLRWQIPIVGDFTCPYGVDFADFAVLSSAWQTEPNDPDWNPACDVSQPKDNFIDELDLAVFCENWLEGTTP